MNKIFDINLLGFLIGVFTLSLSFTSLRATSSVGFFEIMLLFLFGIYVLQHFFFEVNKFELATLLPIIFIVIIVAPLTILNFMQGFYGSSITTLIALIFASFAGSLVYTFDSKNRYSFAFGIGLSAFLSISYIIVSGDLFETLVRFAFLANNPNTLALYSICSCFLIALIYPKGKIRMLLIFSAIFYGIISISDSLFLALFVGTIFGLISLITKKGMLLSGIIITLIISFIILINLELNIFSFFNSLWSEADEGGGRIKLLKHGFEAYLQSPVIGHGAGAFSGSYHPFGRFEAHNTYLDLLTIGGPILMLLFSLPLFLSLPVLYKMEEYLALTFLIAILVFAFFHFTARHPIIWTVWGICLSYIYQFKRSV